MEGFLNTEVNTGDTSTRLGITGILTCLGAKGIRDGLGEDCTEFSLKNEPVFNCFQLLYNG